MTDLRHARELLEHRGESQDMQAADHNAVLEIDACLNDIKKAVTADETSTKNMPQEDVAKDKDGPVHRSRELL